MKEDAKAPGVINANELYTMRQIMRRLGVGEVGMRSMRRKGLPIIRFGNRGYVSGRQAIEFMERYVDETTTRSSDQDNGAAVPGPSVD